MCYLLGDPREMVFARLYRNDENYLRTEDAIARIAPAFRRVILDRVRGEAEYVKEWDKCIALKAPDAILKGYSLAKCNTVWVEVADEYEWESWLRFALWPRREIEIAFRSSADQDRLRLTIEKLARLLDYKFDLHED